jgi:uncharacterized protein (DUF433 family)
MVAHSLIGVGIYTIPEAAQLLEVDVQTARRWVNGYTFHGGGHSDPVFEADFPVARGKQRILSFQDLVELLLIRRFRARKMSLQRIRQVGQTAKRRFNTRHPFATKRVLTDGKYWFEEGPALLGHDGKLYKSLQQLPDRQFVFREIIAPFLQDLDYEGDEARSYWPRGRTSRIVIDRARSFGKPIDNETGIPTFALYEAHLAGDSIEEVARWYHVPVEAVQAAVEYEKSLRKA